MVRKAVFEDLKAIEKIYREAREFMKKSGNPDQWGETYPENFIIENDIGHNRLYVVERDDRICGVFMFECEEDPTYAEIDGAWLDDDAYGVIHRVASKAGACGIFSEAFAFARTKINHLRMDTYPDNRVMQGVLLHYGFKPCGTIFLEDGRPFLAYEYTEQGL